MGKGLRSYLLLGLLIMIREVLMQGVTVEAALGGSVVLQCSTPRYEKNVFWRHTNRKTVYDIIEGEEDFHDQDAAFRGRVKGFPSEFRKGNYSIILSDVRPTDSGTFRCEIPESNTVYVELKVKERRVVDPDTNARGGGVMRRAGGISLSLLLLCSFAV